LDIGSDAGLLMIEQWRSTQHLQRHIQSEDVKKIFALLDLSEGPPEFGIYTVSGTMRLEDIAGWRSGLGTADDYANRGGSY
jgi:hypothetical protein